MGAEQSNTPKDLADTIKDLAGAYPQHAERLLRLLQYAPKSPNKTPRYQHCGFLQDATDKQIIQFASLSDPAMRLVGLCVKHTNFKGVMVQSRVKLHQQCVNFQTIVKEIGLNDDKIRQELAGWDDFQGSD